jgi:hypothetical protein
MHLLVVSLVMNHQCMVKNHLNSRATSFGFSVLNHLYALLSNDIKKIYFIYCPVNPITTEISDKITD